MALQKPNNRRIPNKDEEDEKKRQTGLMLPTFEELVAIEEKAKEDAAAAVSSEKGLDLFQRPSNWDDGYQFGDITKTALGTLGDIGVGAVKGVVRMGEGIGDAAQYGAAALADLFGADEKAEAIRQNAQRDKVTEAFSGVDEKLNKYSVLGRTSDAAAESLGQIGAIVGTAGLAGALGAGAVGTTAATTGLMGLSSFGSGTGEAYAAGADEGEAEAYGAIAGAADALSEMIFGGLGKGFKALGLSKGITSADDLLAKAVTSKIRNTLAKNAVQLGIKAGAEGLEEVLAGTMQAAGKKATYMSERDFADIIKDENLLEQFVVGAMASGISQTPSFVSATRAGVDLVSDGAAPESDSAQDKFAALRDKNADFGKIERTGLASGANEDDIRMAGELSTVLGKKIRFFREEAKNGTINNGEYHEDTDEIWINARSKNVKAQIVAHELTHSIEKNDGYRQLVGMAMEKLEAEQKAKGRTLDDLYREKEMLYADGNVRLASYDEITSELVAEYVEKRLLTDEASIKSLVSENRTLGQRIREWFDSLLAKMGNASAKERDYIRQMRDVYARALGEDVIETGDNVIKHDISVTEDGKMYVTASRNVITGKNTDEKREQITNFFKELLQDKRSLDIQTVEGDVLTLTMSETAKKARDKAKQVDGVRVELSDAQFGVKLNAEAHVDELAEISKKIGNSPDKKNHPFAKDGFTYRRAYFEDFDGKYYEITLSVGHNGTTATVYNVTQKESTPPTAKVIAVVGSQPRGMLSKNSISQNGENVKGQNAGNTPHSISKVDDQRYKEAVDRGDMETAQRMVNEAAEEKGWIPVTRYHQTGKQFTKFSNENPDAGLNDSDTPNGFFFKENDHDIGVGGDYVKTGHGGNVQMPVFLKMENVLSFKNRDDARSWYTKNVPGYMELLKKYEEYQAEYKRLDNENTGKMFEELERLDESGEYTASKADAVMKKYDAVIDDWIEKTKDYETGLRSEMRKLLNDFFLNGNSEYDAIELEDDGHRYIDGKREDVHTYIVFKNTQIKSSKPVTYDDNGNVIPLSERFKRDNDDIRHSVSREDASVTEAETDQTLQQIRNDIAADEARYRELTDTVMSNERFNAMMPDEQNAILDEMQSLRERIDRANQIVQDISYEQDVEEDVPMPGDEDVPPQRRSAQAEYGEPETVEVAGEEDPKLTRKVLHKNIMDRIKERFSERGFDFDKVLAKAKDLSTFATVDNTPQRVMEKSLGYKEGRELSDLTIDQAARNETEGIRWLNGFTDKKDGVLAKLSKKYNIKPGSKESAAAQMYAEGFYVSDKNEIVEYGDRELAADFPDAQVRENIKGLAHDPIIRQIYDETLDAINASRTRNAFPEIQKLDNYYLHFRAMDDTFSRLGIPFNPNDIRAKDLPTDLNGVTADLKPGQPYFASAKHRLGKRTSFDLLGGMEKYLTSAKNQIYHIDDIQTLRALRNYVADMYGQAEGLSNLDDLSDEEVEARIKDVYGSHLSTFAKFLNEEANVLAGKTSLIDRGLEGVIGRRGITFLNDVNRQVGANMVGYNISSSLTNFLAPVQAFAKMNKAAFIKGFAQTVENRMKSITGGGDDFAQKSDVIVRRKGADRFHRTAWQKMSDPGYLLMGMVDDISTEIIARAKYNELTAKGMDAETANRETDKWVSRLMGDRSLGQMPQIFNSKMLGLVTKFQLEVRNQIDSQFYDTIKEAQVQYEEIGDKAKRNAKTAAKVAATFAELALAQHVFGSVFESIAGYNPAFDIIEVIATVLGLDDDEESEDTALDNIEQGVLALIEDLPYSSVILDGGRIPVSSAMPIGEIIKGQDEYGNDINRMKTVAEAVPYYALPGGYGQIKKTAKGLSMFSGDKEVTGSYTDSGNLRFPVEATPGNIAQAAVFGQWASENARDYFDNERKPANKRQTMGYAESGLEWKEFQRYRDQISKLDRDADKLALIKSLDIDQTAKEALYRYLVASAKKDDDSNIIGSSEDERLAALYATGLDFDDFLDAKQMQSALNANESMTANQRASRFLAWTASQGYTDAQADVIGENFGFSSGFRVKSETYQKIVDGGVDPDNAVKVSDALAGKTKTADKINAVWSTGLSGNQLDLAVKSVLSEKAYERYRIVVDANIPLEIYTWALLNADQDAEGEKGHGSVNNTERELILSQLALPRKDLSALWLALGGSEKSNPYSGIGVKIEMPKIEMPKIELPKIELPKIGG